MGNGWAGAPHGGEISFVFGTLTARPGPTLSPEDQAVSRMAQSYWVNFAKSGDPNGADLPRWDAAAGSDRLLLITNDRLASGDDPWSERLDRLGH